MIKEQAQVTLKTRLRANPNLVLREESDGCAVLFDPETGALRLLNETATAIWKLLQQEHTAHRLLQQLRQQFEGIDDEAGQQTLDLLRELCSSGDLAILDELA